MTERGDSSDDTQVKPAEAEAPEISESAGAQAVAEGASEAVDPPPAAAPAPALDESAATPDRSDPVQAAAGVAEERPELLVAGAFVGGLALALVLKKVGSSD
jgi:hypothetical protein